MVTRHILFDAALLAWLSGQSDGRSTLRNICLRTNWGIE
jgi:hypothetical protein